jgi:hypothetical protein
MGTCVVCMYSYSDSTNIDELTCQYRIHCLILAVSVTLLGNTIFNARDDLDRTPHRLQTVSNQSSPV